MQIRVCCHGRFLARVLDTRTTADLKGAAVPSEDGGFGPREGEFVADRELCAEYFGAAF